MVDERSLVDALDDLGASGAYSEPGYQRLVRLRDELRRLRRWTASSLPDLVTMVVRALDLDVELASRPGVRPVDALLDVDRLVEVAEEFVGSGEDPGLVAFLAYLDTAQERERGLEVEVAEPEGERVQLMTVHAAKGLEWDAVFVAGLAQDVFPVGRRPVADWSKQLATLPFPLRGDRDELPELDWLGATDQDDAKTRVEAFQQACRDRGALEERRLAYVAVTRARSLLACSGYWWDTTVKHRGPSSLLTEMHELCAGGGGTVDVWTAEPEEGDLNPMAAEPASGEWPYDPLGPRRPAVSAAAEAVRAAGRRDGSGATEVGAPSGGATSERAEAWDRELELLLAELARSRETADEPVVELPARLSVSQLVELRRDPVRLARSLRRPLPRRPAPQARRGTRFHLWLEQLWGQQRLLDVDQLPGLGRRHRRARRRPGRPAGVLPGERLVAAGARRGGVPLRHGRRRDPAPRPLRRGLHRRARRRRRRRRLEDRRAPNRRRGDGRGGAARGLPAGLAPRHRDPAGAGARGLPLRGGQPDRAACRPARP